MEKRGLTRIGIFALFLAALVIFISSISYSTSFTDIKDKQYSLGESIKFDFSNQEYYLKIVTPSTSFVRESKNDKFSFKLNEKGKYTFSIKSNGLTEKYDVFVGVAQPAIDKPVVQEIVTNNLINQSQRSTEASLENINKTEFIKSSSEKEVRVYPKERKSGTFSVSSVKNLTVSTEIDSNVEEEDRIKVLWKEKNEFIDFQSTRDANGLIENISWTVSNSEVQTFEIIILITNAEHLDANKTFISDIYESVKELDGIWSEAINSEEYVRVSFEKKLTKINDITIYPRIISGNPSVEVYELGSNLILANFSVLNNNSYNKIYLTNLETEQDTFDLKVLGGQIQFDHIIDPSANDSLNKVYQCGSIDIAGTYLVNQTITGAGTCLSINANNVNLDCQGNNVVYNTGGTNGAMGINVSDGTTFHSNITIRNCKIIKSSAAGTTSYGIQFVRLSNSTIFNSTILTNGTNDNYGIYLVNATANNITKNVIQARGTTTNNYGVYLAVSSSRNILFNNNISTFGTGTNYGIYILGSSTYTNSNNSALYNLINTAGTVGAGGASNFGIYITVNASQNNVTGNNITTNGTTTNHGIYILGTAGNRADSNILANNTIRVYGRAAAVTNYGIIIQNLASGNNVTGNNITTLGMTNNYGIYLTGTNALGVRNSVLDSNIIYTLGNSTNNYGIYLLTNISQNDVLRNTIRTNGTTGNIGIAISGTTTPSTGNDLLYNYIYTNGTTGNHGIYLTVNVSDNNVTGNNITANGTSTNYGIYLLGTAGNPVRDNIIANNSIIADGRAAAVTNYGIILQNLVTYTNVTGNNLLTYGTATNYGIYLTGTNALGVNNNLIALNYVNTKGNTTNNYGIYLLTNTSQNDVIGNTIRTNGTTGNIGIAISGTTTNSILNDLAYNDILTNGTTGNHGIYLTTNASQNNITGNNIVANGTTTNYGIYLLGTAGNPVNNNIIDLNNVTVLGIAAAVSNIGMFISTNTNNNNLTNNNVSVYGTTNSQGIELLGSATLTCNNNTVAYNNILVNGSSASAATDYGIYLTANTNANNILYNNITTVGSTTGYGIYLLGASTTPVYNNSIRGNNVRTLSTGGASNHGIYLTANTNGNTLLENLVSSSGTTTNYGIYLLGTANNAVKNNRLSGNRVITNGTTASNYGIYLNTNASNNSIVNNTISTNGTTTNHGIYLVGISGNPVVNNTLTNNTIDVYGRSGAVTNYGIIIQNLASDNNVTGNNITTYGMTANYGIYLTGTNALGVRNNFVSLNTIYSRGNTTNNYGIYLLSNVSQNDILNNTIYTNGTSGNIGISLNGTVITSDANDLLFNLIFTSGLNSNYGIYLGNSSHNNISLNTISTNGTDNSSDALMIYGRSQNNTFARNTILTARGNGISLVNTTGVNFPDRNIFINNEFNNIGGRDLLIEQGINGTVLLDQAISQYNFTRNISFVQVATSLYGHVRFMNNISGAGNNLSDEIIITNNSLYLNGSNTGLNISANILLQGIRTNFSNPVILLDGTIICNQTNVFKCANFTSLNAGNVSFNVSSWSKNYSIGEYPIPPVAPNASITFPLNTTYNTNVSELNYTCSDAAFVLYSRDNFVTNSTPVACGTNFTNVLSVQGTNTWRIAANSTLGLINITNVTFFLDSIAPNVSITFPTNTTYTSNVSALNYTCSDGTFALYSGDNFVTNSTPVVCGTNFTNVLSVQGTNTWRIAVNDSLNNINITNVTFFLDSIAPNVSITFPTNTTYTSNVSALNYTCSDGTFALYSRDNFAINSTIVACGTNFTNVISVQGSNTWKLAVNDSFNNLNITNITFFMDTLIPTVQFGLQTESNDSKLTIRNIVINVTANDTNLVNISITLYNSSMNIVNQTNSTNPNYINITNLIDGNYTFNASAYDTVGNINYTATYQVRIDATIPIPRIVYPLNISYNSNVSEFNYTFTETNPDSCWYSVDEGATNSTINTCGTNFTNVLSVQGTNNWRLYINDSFGNLNMSNVTFSLDNSNPLISYGSDTESNNSLITRSNIVINVTAEDPSLVNVTIFLFNSSMDIVNQTTTTVSPNYVNITNLIDGNYTFNASAYDLAGNVNYTYTYNIIIDTTVPSINLMRPILFGNYSNNNISLNFSVSDLRLDSCWFTINNGTTNTSISNCRNTSFIAGQFYTNLSLYANDTAGNVNVAKSYFFVDSLIPLIYYGIGTENNNTDRELNNIYVNVSLTENNFGNITFNLYNKTSGVLLVNSTTYSLQNLEINFTNLSNKNITYLYNVTVYDSIGNMNFTETRTLKLFDATAPNLSLFSPENDTYDYNTSLPLDFFVFDTNLDKCWYNLDNTANTTVSCYVNATFDASDGQHRLYLYANDSLNNRITRNVTFVSNSSLLLTPDYVVQRGVVVVNVVNNSTLTVRTDRTKSFILLNTRSASSTANILHVGANYTNSTSINFYNYAGSATVEWESISGPTITAQRGTAVHGTTDITLNITISPVNLSSSFIIINDRLNTATANQYLRGMWTGVFRNTTMIQLQRATTGTAGEVFWQVVDWTGAVVQNGTVAMTGVSSFANLTSNIQTDRTFVIASSRAVTSTNANSLFGNARVINLTTLQLSRGGGAAGTLTMAWFTVSHDVLRVSNISQLMGAVASSNVTVPTLVNISKTFRVASYNSSGAVTTYANAHVTSAITNFTNVKLDKGATTQTNVIALQTVEFIERNVPIVNLRYPLNQSNFSNLTISSFNYTVYDDTSINNCSLLGTWVSSSLGINQTILNPQVNTPNNFSLINLESDGYYLWNVQCYDLYGNLGINSTNYSFAAFLPAIAPIVGNITQAYDNGTGNITLAWTPAAHAAAYNIYYSTNATSFVFLNQTNTTSYNDTSFQGNKRRFYLISAWNPTYENLSSELFVAQVYSLSKTTNTRNWIGFIANNSLVTANQTLYEVNNISAITMWNATIQKAVTCNLFSCPSFPSCTPTNCNFNTEQGAGYEVNLNSSAPSQVNWSTVGKVYSPANITLIKNSTGSGKNWVSFYANTKFVNAQTVLGNTSRADAITRWNGQAQTSQGLIPSPFPSGPRYIGTNFSISFEEAYEISVNQTVNFSYV